MGREMTRTKTYRSGAFFKTAALALLAFIATAGCKDPDPKPVPLVYAGDHGPYLTGVFAPLGDPMASATAAQREIFAEGKEVSLHRFERSEGLGPAFNVTFCAGCHERPTPGGSAGLYRNFSIGGTTLDDGTFVPSASAGDASGVLRKYYYGEDPEIPAHPALDSKMNTVGNRNPIPFYGVGLLAEIPDEELLKRVDEDDADGDGISGRANYDRGFVGRFGRKSQTVSIEGFIRGPLFNHLGLTSDPLTDEQRALLPVDSSVTLAARFGGPLRLLHHFAQAAAPDGPLVDDDGIADPELKGNELFALVSYAMLLAPPEPEPLTEQTTRGRDHFNESGCAHCHTPRVMGPRGPLPVYSDFLLHDMGPGLADGITAKLATGSEYRTQPLWGVGVVGPFLHDGRAETLEAAIAWHGGEAQSSRDAAMALSVDERGDLIEFLLSLGGRNQYTRGLLPPGEVAPEVGEYGGPSRELTEVEAEEFEEGRILFDAEFGLETGLGSPRFNGDSCRACHFEPVMGGAGPLGVNVVRHGIRNESGDFIPPSIGSILHRQTALHNHVNAPEKNVNVIELRQTPHLFGLGVIEGITDETIEANADPDDLLTPDGISGRVSWVDGGRLGRFGWKGQVPTLEEFVRDAVTMELGMTVPWVPELTFGRVQDTDDIPDPEFAMEDAQALVQFLTLLGPPPRQPSAEDPETLAGEEVFEDLGCSSCHRKLEGANGVVPLYSDLLLHEILPEGTKGIEEAGAGVRELRTPPLWGLATSGPYLHDGSAEGLDEAIAGHYGEGKTSASAFTALNNTEKESLRAFLESL